MLDTTANTPDTPQASAPAETAPQAPVETDPRAVMESIIAEHAKEAEPAQEPQPAETKTKPDEPRPPEPAKYADPADYDARQTEADHWLIDLAAEDQQTAYELGVAVLNQMPDLIETNRAFLLSKLGLPHNEAEAQRELAEMRRVEYGHARTLASETRAVFDEYVEKGKRLGLNELEAAGLAALAYAEIEGQYWQDGTEARKVFDAWHGHIKSGDKLRSGDGRRAYVKAFEKVYARTAGKYPDPRGRTAGKERTDRPAPVYRGRVGDAEDVMKDVMRQHGMNVDD